VPPMTRNSLPTPSAESPVEEQLASLCSTQISSVMTQRGHIVALSACGTASYLQQLAVGRHKAWPVMHGTLSTTFQKRYGCRAIGASGNDITEQSPLTVLASPRNMLPLWLRWLT